MTLDTRLLEILRCPASGQVLALMAPAQIESLNRAISQGQARCGDGTLAQRPLRHGLATTSQDRFYRVEDSIPVLLASESITVVPPAGTTAG
jgi:uncharacterized protein YbaR (Trm112 family)